MDKYYTPDISEFHVGFEFEVHKSIGLIPDQKEEWVKTAVRIHDRFTSMDLDMRKCCRVKYLDQADIEECGWTTKIKEDRFYFQTEDTEYQMRFDSFGSNEPNRGIGCGIYWGDAWGKINELICFFKNKYELKLLMKMMGIEK